MEKHKIFSWEIDFSSAVVRCYYCEEWYEVPLQRITAEDIYYSVPVCTECVPEVVREFPGTYIFEIGGKKIGKSSNCESDQ